jgi:hypothetical protein
MFMDLSVLLNLSYCLLSRVPILGILCYCVIFKNVTMPVSIRLYPKLDLRTANKLHYITLIYYLLSAFNKIFPNIKLKCTTMQEIESTIKSPKPKTKNGHDDIPPNKLGLY